jgi:hypothetical protein
MKFVVSLFVTLSGVLANASDTFTFLDFDGNKGIVSIETAGLLNCNESPLLEKGRITYQGESRNFKACWNQNKIVEKVIFIVASNPTGEVDLTGQVILNPDYLKEWGKYSKFENSNQPYGCEKNAGGFLNFGNGIGKPIISHTVCFDQ